MSPRHTSTGASARGHARPAAQELTNALNDENPDVAVEAADALCNIGYFDRALPVLAEHVNSDKPWTQLRAVIAADHLDRQATPIIDSLRKAHENGASYPRRVLDYMFKDEKVLTK